MPELPDLEVIREFLAPRLVDVTIVAAEVRRPLLVRNLLGGETPARLVGERFGEVTRRGKFLLFALADTATIVVNPMSAGRLRYGEPLSRHRVRDALVLGLEDGHELRYHDAKDMGKVYLVADLADVPTFDEQGPEAIDPELTLEGFQARLRRHRGEIKGVLTDQRFVAGIGNAYADEILWRAGIYPFKRRPSLSDGEVARLYKAMRETLTEAVAILRERVGTDIDVEVRDFLRVHGKPGERCPRCGGSISEVKVAKRATNICRACQPGLMVNKGRRL